MTRLSAKRMLVVAAGLSLALAAAITALQASDLAVARLAGPETVVWAIPLTIGAVVGLAAWMLLDGTSQGPTTIVHAETVCPSCGRPVLDDWRLCPHCGAFITADGDEPEQERGAS